MDRRRIRKDQIRKLFNVYRVKQDLFNCTVITRQLKPGSAWKIKDATTRFGFKFTISLNLLASTVMTQETVSRLMLRINNMFASVGCVYISIDTYRILKQKFACISRFYYYYTVRWLNRSVDFERVHLLVDEKIIGRCFIIRLLSYSQFWYRAQVPWIS